MASSFCPCGWGWCGGSDADDDEEDGNNSRRRGLLEGMSTTTTNDRIARAQQEAEGLRLRPSSCEGHGPGGGGDETRSSCTHAFADVYTLKDQIGKGSTASCFKCIHKRSGNVVAVKVIDKRRIAVMYSELLHQFRQEVEILRVLNHPHIVRLYEVFESDNALHVVTELVQGGELFDYLVERPDRLLSEAEASGIIRQVAWALAYMHREGVMHRDLKLENILVSARPQDDEDFPTVKIIDFGLAKRYDQSHQQQLSRAVNSSSNHHQQQQQLQQHASSSTEMEGNGEQSASQRVSEVSPPMDIRPTANTFFGTLGYIAPEMMKRKGYTSQVDNWALGVLTYVLLCGIFPFDDDPSVASSRRQADYVIKFPPWAKISDSAKDLLRKLLEVNPNRRLTAGKALVHPWVAGETASRNAVLGTPKLLEELRRNNMYGTSHGVRTDAAVSRSGNMGMVTASSSSAFGGGGAGAGSTSEEAGDLLSKGSVSPLALDEHIRKSLAVTALGDR